MRISATLCAVGGVVALLLLSAGSAGSANRLQAALPKEGGVAVAQFAAASLTARSFDGVAAVGGLFTETDGKLGTHFCTASVVHSAAGDLALTAAHCVYGRSGTMAFVPGYALGQTPYGVWQVTKVYTDSAWDSAQDPDHDVAFLKLADAPDGVPIENVTGAETLGTGLPAGELVQVIGYPDDADQPVWCAWPGQGVQRHPTGVRLRRVPRWDQRWAVSRRREPGDRPGHCHRRDRRLPAGRRHPAGVVRRVLRRVGRRPVRAGAVGAVSHVTFVT